MCAQTVTGQKFGTDKIGHKNYLLGSINKLLDIARSQPFPERRESKLNLFRELDGTFLLEMANIIARNKFRSVDQHWELPIISFEK